MEAASFRFGPWVGFVGAREAVLVAESTSAGRWVVDVHRIVEDGGQDPVPRATCAHALDVGVMARVVVNDLEPDTLYHAHWRRAEAASPAPGAARESDALGSVVATLEESSRSAPDEPLLVFRTARADGSTRPCVIARNVGVESREDLGGDGGSGSGWGALADVGPGALVLFDGGLLDLRSVSLRLLALVAEAEAFDPPALAATHAPARTWWFQRAASLLEAEAERQLGSHRRDVTRILQTGSHVARWGAPEWGVPVFGEPLRLWDTLTDALGTADPWPRAAQLVLAAALRTSLRILGPLAPARAWARAQNLARTLEGVAGGVGEDERRMMMRTTTTMATTLRSDAGWTREAARALDADAKAVGAAVAEASTALGATREALERGLAFEEEAVRGWEAEAASRDRARATLRHHAARQHAVVEAAADAAAHAPFTIAPTHGLDDPSLLDAAVRTLEWSVDVPVQFPSASAARVVTLRDSLGPRVPTSLTHLLPAPRSSGPWTTMAKEMADGDGFSLSRDASASPLEGGERGGSGGGVLESGEDEFVVAEFFGSNGLAELDSVLLDVPPDERPRPVVENWPAQGARGRARRRSTVGVRPPPLETPSTVPVPASASRSVAKTDEGPSAFLLAGPCVGWRTPTSMRVACILQPIAAPTSRALPVRCIAVPVHEEREGGGTSSEARSVETPVVIEDGTGVAWAELAGLSDGVLYDVVLRGVRALPATPEEKEEEDGSGDRAAGADAWGEHGCSPPVRVRAVGGTTVVVNCAHVPRAGTEHSTESDTALTALDALAVHVAVEQALGSDLLRRVTWTPTPLAHDALTVWIGGSMLDEALALVAADPSHPIHRGSERAALDVFASALARPWWRARWRIGAHVLLPCHADEEDGAQQEARQALERIAARWIYALLGPSDADGEEEDAEAVRSHPSEAASSSEATTMRKKEEEDAEEAKGGQALKGSTSPATSAPWMWRKRWTDSRGAAHEVWLLDESCGGREDSVEGVAGRSFGTALARLSTGPSTASLRIVSQDPVLVESPVVWADERRSPGRRTWGAWAVAPAASWSVLRTLAEWQAKADRPGDRSLVWIAGSRRPFGFRTRVDVLGPQGDDGGDGGVVTDQPSEGGAVGAVGAVGASLVLLRVGDWVLSAAETLLREGRRRLPPVFPLQEAGFVPWTADTRVGEDRRGWPRRPGGFTFVHDSVVRGPSAAVVDAAARAFLRECE